VVTRSLLLAAGFTACGLSLTGCADFGGPVDGQAKLSPTEIRLQAAETKLAEISKRLDALNQLMMDSAGGGRAVDELRSLRGDVEKLRFDLDSQEKRGRDLYQDLDRRLAKLEGTAPASGAATNAPGAAAPASPPSAALENPSAPQEEAAYLQAFDLLKGGRYDDSIRGFRAMIQRWPEGRYADNAWYWMGKAYYLKQDYAPAIQSFQTVVERFPKSPKAPDALFDLAVSQGENRQKDQARATLQRVVRDYPTSNAANLARQRLAQP
jgi:tol-pal system protein YbgF